MSIVKRFVMSSFLGLGIIALSGAAQPASAEECDVYEVWYCDDSGCTHEGYLIVC